MSAVVAGEAVIRAVLRLDTASTKKVAADAEKTLGGTLKKTGAGLTSVGKRATLAITAPIVAAGGAALNIAAGFEKSMIRVGIATQAPAAAMDAMKKKAIELGNSTVFSATDAADAMGELGRAGFSTEDIMKSIGGTLALAATEGIDLGQAAKITASTLSGMGLAAGKAGNVADILATASNASLASVEGLGNALGYAAGQAKISGLNLEQTAGALAVLSNNGIDASRSGTSLNQMLRSLSNPTAKLSKQLERYHVKVKNADGSMRDLQDIFKDVGKAGPKAVNDIAAAMSVNGSRAFTALAGSADKGAKSYDSIVKQLGDVDGAAEKMGNQLTGGASGAMEKLSSAVETLAISIADSGLLDVFTEIVLKVTDLVNYLGTLSPEKMKIGVIFAGIAAAIGPALIAIGSVVSAIGTLAGVIGPALAALLGPVGLIAAAIIALGVAFYAAWKNSLPFRAFVIVLGRNIAAFAKGVASGFLSAFKPLVDWWQNSDLKTILSDLGGELSNLFETITPYMLKAIPVMQQVGKVIGEVIGGALVRTFTFLGDLIAGVFNIVKGVLELVVGFFEAIFTGNTETLKKGAVDLLKGILDAILGFVGLVLGPKIRKSLGDAFTAMINWVKKLLGINSPSKVFTDIARDLMLGLINGITGMISRIRSAISRVNDKIISTAKSILTKMLTFGRNLITNLVSGVTGSMSKVSSGITKLKNKILDGVKSLASKMYNAGANAVQGLANGVSDFIWRAVDKARQLAQSVVNTVTGLFDSHSPSRRFFQEGENVGAGLALGMDSTRTKRRVSDASSGMANAAIAPVHEAQPQAQAGGGFSIVQNYYGPQTNAGKVQELNWANRYRTSLRRFGDPAVVL